MPGTLAGPPWSESLRLLIKPMHRLVQRELNLSYMVWTATDCSIPFFSRPTSDPLLFPRRSLGGKKREGARGGVAL